MTTHITLLTITTVASLAAVALGVYARILAARAQRRAEDLERKRQELTVSRRDYHAALHRRPVSYRVTTGMHIRRVMAAYMEGTRIRERLVAVLADDDEDYNDLTARELCDALNDTLKPVKPIQTPRQ